MDTTIGETPFSVLMDQAVKLKNAQVAPQRSKFDSYPSFYQNSIYPRPEVVRARDAAKFDDRMAAALAFKEAGNADYRNEDFEGAAFQYEMALSVFRYLENTNQSWRTEGIKDEFIKQISYESNDPQERQQVAGFLVSCYGNMALACLKAGKCRIAIDACNEALAIDRNFSKALYLRSQAVIMPKSAGAVEQDMALKDLENASKIDPSNKDIRKAFVSLCNAARAQKQTDRKTFGGMFERGSISVGTDLQGEAKEEDAKKAYTIGEAKDLADMLAKRGFAKEEKALRKRIEQANSEAQEPMNFRRPSQKMIEEAEKRGVDLSEERVLCALEQLQKERFAAVSAVRQSGGERKSRGSVISHFRKWLRLAPKREFRFVLQICLVALACGLMWWSPMSSTT